MPYAYTPHAVLTTDSSVTFIDKPTSAVVLESIHKDATIQIELELTGETNSIIFPKMTVEKYIDMSIALMPRNAIPTLTASTGRYDALTIPFSKKGSIFFDRDNKYKIIINDKGVDETKMHLLFHKSLGDRISLNRLYLDSKDDVMTVSSRNSDYLFFFDGAKPDTISYQSEFQVGEGNRKRLNTTTLTAFQLDQFMLTKRITRQVNSTIQPDATVTFTKGLPYSSWIIPLMNLNQVDVNFDSSQDLEFHSIEVNPQSLALKVKK